MTGFGYCHVAISPMRAEASDRAEIVSQLLFGEPIEILEIHEQWRKIRSYIDNYEGWIDEKHLTPLREKAFFRWLDTITTEHQLIRRLQTPLGTMRIFRGAFVSVELTNTFSIGDHHYEWLDDEAPFPTSIVELAQDYLNTPYLWGGKSPFGIDCSGFMQVIHRLFDINLPRDAYEQQEHGSLIPFGEQQASDLVFFENASGKIHHVGLLINENEIIHASGFVRIDDFTKEGIIRRTDGYLSHRFHSIKRI